MAGPGDFFTDPVSFIYGGNTGLSYSDLQRRRQIAVALASRQRKFPTNLGEGLTYFGEALGDTIQDRRLAAAEGQYKAGEDQRERGITPSTYIPGVNANPPVSGATPSPGAPAGASQAPAGTAANPITPAPIAGPANVFNPASITNEVPAVDSVPAVRPVQPVRSVAPPNRAGVEDPVWARRSQGIAGIESGGAKDPYTLLGARTKTGDRAYGKYQIMGANIPNWTEAALGQRMTPDEFLANRNAQEATFRNRFGNYVDKYGEEGAARAWYAGERGMKNLGATDVHGRLTVAGYGQDYLRRLGGAQGPAGAPAGARDAIAAQMTPPPAGPPTPRELASQELLQETVGVGGGGPLYPPTASAGRAGVTTDAPSVGASPLGAITDPSIGDTLQRQRGGGVGGIMPLAPPTVLPMPQIAQNRARSVPVTASDAAMGALPGSVAPPSGFGAAPPRAAAPAMSEETIPPMSQPPIKGPPREPTVFGPDPAMQKDLRIMNSDVSQSEKDRAKARYQQAEYYMNLRNTQEQERYKHERGLWEREPMRVLDEQLKRGQIAETLAKRRNEPYEAEKLRLQNEETRQKIADMKRMAGRPAELSQKLQEQQVTEGDEKERIRQQFGGLPQKEVFEHLGKSKETAAAGAQSFAAIQTAKNALAGGAITGFGADARLNWSKFTTLMGLEDKGNDVANTEVFRSAMAPAVAGLLKSTVGSANISNADREFAEKAAGGTITLDEKSIKRLLDVSHRMGVEAVRSHQTKMDALFPNNPQAKTLFGVDLPIPAPHIERLRKNPDKASDFDEMYGQGAADRVLRGQR